jgi:uncharacterized membrane protein
MIKKVIFDWERKIGPVIRINFFNKKIGLCFCHRKPQRCFKIKGYTFPICSRCCGLFFGIILSMTLILFAKIPPFLISFIFLFPMLIDGLTQLFFKRTSNNPIRFFTGSMFSFGCISMLVMYI